MKKMDYVLFGAVIILSLFGLLMIYSSSYIWAEYKYNNPYKFIINQGIFFIVGLLLMIIISKINHKILEKKCNLIFLISFVLLILVLIPGIGSVRNGSRSWFGIGSFGIQPSEFMKLAFIIFTSKYLTFVLIFQIVFNTLIFVVRLVYAIEVEFKDWKTKIILFSFYL